MGSACSSSNEVQPNPSVDKQAPDKAGKSDQKHESIHKLLLLGTGDAGKTTLYKQLSAVYGRPMSEADRRTYLPVLANNLIWGMKALVAGVDKYGELGSAEARAARTYVESELKGDEELDERLCDQLKALWADPAVQTAYQNRAEVQCPDNLRYLMEKVDELCRRGYVPSEQDVLRCRVRTTGIVDSVFSADGVPFKLFDFGGQKHERKKWQHCFEHASGIIFVAALSEYDQVLHEDEKTNRLAESLALWEELCNGRWFRDTPLLLFLSKRDLFLEKCATSPLNRHFPDAPPMEADAKTQEAWIRGQFESRSRLPERKVVVHALNLTDSAAVAAAAQSIRDAIVSRPLKTTREV